MEFDKIKKNGVSNSTFKSDNRLKETAKNKNKESKKIEEFSSNYSNAQRALGLANVSFKGDIKEKNNFEKEFQQFKQTLENDENFPKNVIEYILERTNKDNIEAKKEVYAVINKIEDFPKKEIENILYFTNGENFNFARELCLDENFPKEEIRDILKNTNKDNLSLALEIYQDEKFPKEKMGNILRSANKDNISFAQMLWNDEDFPKEEIEFVLSNTNKENISLAHLLWTIDGFPKEMANYILQNTNKDNLSFAKELCLDKNFPKNTVKYILQNTNKDNLSFAQMLWNDEDFPKEEIETTLLFTNKENIEAIEKMYKTIKEMPSFPKEEIGNILRYINDENLSFAQTIISDKNFPKKRLGNVIFHTNKTNIEAKNEMYRILKNIKEITDKNISKILENTNESNILLAQKLCQDKDFPKEEIGEILHNTDKHNVDAKVEIYKIVKSIEDFPKDKFQKIIYNTDEDNIEYCKELIQNRKKNEYSIDEICALIESYGHINEEELANLKKMASEKVYNEALDLPYDKMLQIAKLAGLCEKNSINEIPKEQKKTLIKNIVRLNASIFNQNEIIEKYFPLAPKDRDEYCKLLPALVQSLGIEVNKLSGDEIKKFNLSLNEITDVLSEMSDEEFNSLEIKQSYPKENFIEDVLEKISNLDKNEQQKVFDYFGFELYCNESSKVKYSILGYPVNLNNGEKLAQIENLETKKVIENLRNDVIRFSENNEIITSNKDVTKYLNEVASAIPEIHTMIGKSQHGTHSFDIMKHSLKVMQKIGQNEEFKKLNPDDKKLVLLAGLMHDINKKENRIDKLHPIESAFDSYYITKKLNLSKDEEIKLYALIKHHDWCEQANTAKPEEKVRKLQSIAYDFQYDNLFQLAKILTEADLKAVRNDDNIFNKYRNNLEDISKEIDNNIKELQKTRPMLPVTKIPKASLINEKIKVVYSDGSTNIKGVYKDKNGLVAIKYNEVENWEDLGFGKGCISKGIKTTNYLNETIDTGNIKFIAHALDYAHQISNFDAFALPDSDALLSVSYMERPESKYRLFRTQGVLMEVDAKHVHAGGNIDSGSGCRKNIETFKSLFTFGGEREDERNYISYLIKKALKLSDEEYIQFLKENENKPMNKIEPKEVREKLVKAFATINSNKRIGNREYNEMYVSNPKVSAVFAYDSFDEINNVADFIEKQPDFLKEYAIEKDIPLMIFGD